MVYITFIHIEVVRGVEDQRVRCVPLADGGDRWRKLPFCEHQMPRLAATSATDSAPAIPTVASTIFVASLMFVTNGWECLKLSVPAGAEHHRFDWNHIFAFSRLFERITRG